MKVMWSKKSVGMVSSIGWGCARWLRFLGNISEEFSHLRGCGLEVGGEGVGVDTVGWHLMSSIASDRTRLMSVRVQRQSVRSPSGLATSGAHHYERSTIRVDIPVGPPNRTLGDSPGGQSSDSHLMI